MSWQPNDNFKKWALEHSGYNGGKLGPDSIWYCGIEFGQCYKNVEEFRKDFSANYSEAPFIELEKIPEFFNNQFDVKMLKLNTLLHNEPIEAYKSFSLSSKVLTSEGDVFKFNLYPIACRDTDESLWHHHYYEATGFPTKALYKAWCQEHRFPKLRNLREQHKPKIIICAGNSYERDFLLAFAGEEYIFQQPTDTFENGLVNYYQVVDTKIFIIPFFGRPLNADAKIQKVGDFIKSFSETKLKAA